MKLIKYHWQLDVYKLAVEAAMDIFELTKRFPREEMYSLTDQVRRSSRSVSAQIAEAWRRRKYEAVFVNKMNESEGEVAETQGWIELCRQMQLFERKRRTKTSSEIRSGSWKIGQHGKFTREMDFGKN